MAETAEFRPVFVVGVCGRSGTTLMAAMLDRHSRICIPPETQFFARAAAIEWPAGPSAVARLLRAERMRDLQLEPDEVIARLGGRFAQPADVLRVCLEQYAARYQKPRCGEKSPPHLSEAEQLLAWYPAARVVCMIRDGRDTAMSLVSMPWAHASLVRHSLQWAALAARADRLQRAYPDRFVVVRYEDVVRDPGSTLRRVCQFVGEPFEPTQLDPVVATGVVPAWERAWKQRASAAITDARIGRWRAEASAYQIALMEWAMAAQLEAWGYAVSGGELASPWRYVAALRGVPFHPRLRPLLARTLVALNRAGIGYDPYRHAVGLAKRA